MLSQIPDNSVQKAIQNPSAAIRYVKKEWICQLPSHIHLAIKTHDLQRQQDKLAQLRKKSNFCLIVLDACRYDVLNECFDDYFEGSIFPTKTVATNTFDYLQYNWPETYEYPYITAATPVTSEQFNFDGEDAGDGLPQTSEKIYEYYRGYVPANHFSDLKEVWRQEWNDDLRVCPPEPVTERAITYANNTSRMVTHYFQPHAPFIGEKRPSIEREKSAFDDPDVKIDSDVWQEVKRGNISLSELRTYYKSNLRRVLAAVVKMVQNTDFDRYVIIGDHGEALGEYERFAHSIEHPYVSVVPWAIVDNIKPAAPRMWEYSQNTNNNIEETTTESRLRDLGYIE